MLKPEKAMAICKASPHGRRTPLTLRRSAKRPSLQRRGLWNATRKADAEQEPVKLSQHADSKHSKNVPDCFDL